MCFVRAAKSYHHAPRSNLISTSKPSWHPVMTPTLRRCCRRQYLQEKREEKTLTLMFIIIYLSWYIRSILSSHIRKEADAFKRWLEPAHQTKQFIFSRRWRNVGTRSKVLQQIHTLCFLLCSVVSKNYYAFIYFNWCDGVIQGRDVGGIPLSFRWISGGWILIRNWTGQCFSPWLLHVFAMH